MKRTPFARTAPADRIPQAPRIKPVAQPLTRPVRYAEPANDTVAPIAKEIPVRSEPYRRLVAALPCANCRIFGYSQAAHPNTGKGQGTKTDDRLCFPLCADRPGVRGCHAAFDQGAMFSRVGRQLVEQAWGADTRRIITAQGDWPAKLLPLESTGGENRTPSNGAPTT